MKNQVSKAVATLGFALFAMSTNAQQAGGGQDEGGKKMDTAKATKLTDGEVKDVDAKAGHVTLKHGTIENMNMGPMTMTFAVKEKSALSGLTKGSKVKFAVENMDNVPTVTTLIPQK
ncbi:copper-binding protein [Noviherbaspirillum suwonense]|uniref:Cu and Ag efflux protein CusF n=1 Tax=Noviherbaspirillum suwonense TaxID=1224511 RepID=A0ABY1PYX5_9BURK|nr:copper-binding protein [Noviherbaspirillum suwonense]SMP52278.1 Cu and Ag efflux protein CusF [Noviherbaspirillum suwonense]